MTPESTRAVAHVCERGGGAEISHQHWAIHTRNRHRRSRPEYPHPAISDRPTAHVHTGLDARSHHHRINVEEFDDGRTEGVHHFRHHRTDDHIVHIGWLKTAHSQEFSQKQPILIRRMVGFGGDAGRCRRWYRHPKSPSTMFVLPISTATSMITLQIQMRSCAILRSGYDGLRWSTQRGGQP